MDIIVFETEYCKIGVPNPPHVSREDGGHMVIFPKRKVRERWELPEMEAVEMMLVSRALGRAMTEVLTEEDIIIQTINYQDNGNWAFLRGEDTSFHIHLYGRAANSKNQVPGEALFFPYIKEHPFFYERNVRLRDEEIEKIVALFQRYYTQRQSSQK